MARAGNGRGAAIGAGAGALAGALIGAAVADDQARYYHAPPGGYPYAERTGTPGYVYSPYGDHNVIDVRGVPEGALGARSLDRRNFPQALTRNACINKEVRLPA